MRKRMTSILLMVAMLVTMIPSNALTALASEQAVAYNSGSIVSEAETTKENDSAMGTMDGSLMESETVEPLLANAGTDETTVTRIEWLAALVETFEMTVEEDNYPDNYYSDLSSASEDYATAMVATEFGLVDVPAGDALRPADPATREFVVHSLNLCLGYPNTAESYTFSESGSVTYPDDIQVAVDKGWFALTDGAFLPENALTATEKETLLTMAQTIYKSTEIDPNHVNTWELADGVIDLTADVQAQLTDENEYTLTNCSYALQVGDVYAVLIDGIPLVKKVVSVTAEGTTYVVQTEDVELSAAYKSLDIQGSAKADLTQAVACSEDIQIEYIVGGTAEKKWQDGETYSSVEALGDQTVDAIAVTKSIEIPRDVKKTYNIADGITADITCTMSDPYTDYYAEIWTLNPCAYFYTDAILTFDCNVSMDVLEAMGVAPSIQLVKIALPGDLGYFKVTLEMALQGNIDVNYVQVVGLGVQVDLENGYRTIQTNRKLSSTITAHAEGSVGVKATAGFNVFSILMGDLYAEIGAKATLDIQSYDDGQLPLKCTHIHAWLYLTVGGSFTFHYGLGTLEKIDRDDIWHKRNSPVKVFFHYEDGERVDRCTRDDVGTNNSANSNTTTSRWKYYTPADSRYGYGGGSSGTGSNGQPYTIFEYDVTDENKAKITSYRGNVSALTIPSTLDGYEVAEIGSNAFKGNTQLRVVTIPDSVTSLGYTAFSGCANLSSVSLSANLEEIGQKTFYNCDALTNIEIPKSLTGGDNVLFYGDYGPFASCSSLKTVSFEEGVTEICGNLFSGCDGIEEIVIPDTVTKIQVSAFQDSGLKKITISNGVTQIGNNAFEGCVFLESIVLPDSVTGIAGGAFSGCSSLQSVVLSKKLSEIGQNAFYNCDALTSIEIPKSLKGGDNVLFYGDYGPFASCSSLKEVSFEAGVTEICGNLFSGCDGIEEIVVPDTVTKIQVSAFQDSSLKKIIIPDSVTRIGNKAFEGCVYLDKVVIPDSVISLGGSAFSGCSNLKSVALSKALTEIGNYAFYDCDGLTSIEIPKTLEAQMAGGWISSTVQGPFSNCSNLKEVSFEEGTTSIKEFLFNNCDGLEEITIPDSVKVIGIQSFQNCKNLQKVEISDSVIDIRRAAFEGCAKMESAVIPDSVTSLGAYAFYGCSKLSSVKLSESLISIGDYAFLECSSLMEVTLPNSVTSMGTNMFKECTALVKAFLPNSCTTVPEYTFYNCSDLLSIELPDTITKIGSNAFYNCDAITSIEIPDSVTSIGTYCFYGCDSLADVTLGTGITTIPSYAFNLCPALESIIIPYRVTTINSNAFTNCTKLTEVTIPRATTSIADGVFSYPGKVTIYGISGTYAETYANENSITFVNSEVPATALTIQPTELQLLDGKTAQLALSITPANFTDTITWRSSDTAVATVADGKVTAVAPGTATISVLAGDTGAVKATCTVTVVQPVTRVNIDKSSITMEGGDTYTLVATVTPDTAYDKTLVWTSSDEAVATVSQEGVVTALKKGTAKITATAQDGSGKSDYCNVTVNSTAHIVTDVEELQSEHPYTNNTNEVWIYTVDNADGLDVMFNSATALDDGYDFVYIYDGEGNQVGKYTGTQLAGQTIRVPGNTVKIQLITDDAITGWGFKVDAVVKAGESIDLESIALDKAELVLKPGETGTLMVSYNPTNATVDRTVTWSSSNEQVATVAANGTVTAVAIGTATITAKVGEKEASCVVTVTQDAESITLSAESLKLHYKETAKLTYTVAPAGTRIKTLQATSSAEDVVSVRVAEDLSYVEVTALKAGTAEITLTADEKLTAKCIITVEDTITLDYQDGTGKTETIKAAYGEALSALATINPIREGYLFVGWYTEANGKGTKVTKDTVLTNQWILYAYWRSSDAEFWVEPIDDQMYTGKAIKPAVVVYDGETLLEEKKDYTISYKNNTKANDASDAQKAPMIIVKGKGNYTGKVNVTFKILPQDMEGASFTVDDLAVKYNAKKVQKVTPTVLWKGKKLKVNKDFTVSYPDVTADAYKAPGTYSVKVTGIGNFSGERVIDLTITEGNLMSKAKVSKIAAQAYQDGNPVTPAVTVKMGKETLTQGVHYEVTYENNCEVGTAAVVITGKAGYSGVKRVSFKITGIALNKATIVGLQDKVYDGSAQTQKLSLSLNVPNAGTVALTEGEDYKLSYSKNVNVGKATVVIQGIGKYTGTIKKTFKISASSLESTLSNLQFAVAGQEVSGTTFSSAKIQAVYTKGGSKPMVEIYSKAMDKWLVEGKDFTVAYAQNKALTTSATTKQPTMTIKGKGNFTGKLTKTFEIVPKSLSEVMILVADKQTSAKAGGFVSKPVLIDVDGKTLKEKTDYTIVGYTVRYADGKTESVDAKSVVEQVGAEVTVKLVGQGAYAGTVAQPSEVEATYRITAKGMKGIKVATISKEYTGEAITLSAEDFVNEDGSSKVTVKENGTTKSLVCGKDFEIVEGTYAKNLKKGTATVTIKGLGEYGGTMKVKFKITQKWIFFK